MLAFSLVGSTSYALQLRAMGPEQCCKVHCGHAGMPARADAERCCRSHLAVSPAIFDKSLTASGPAVSGLAPVALPPLHLLAAARRPIPMREARLARAGTLVALHTSLLR